MEEKGKLTKEVVAQEARFILDHLLNSSKYGPEVQVEELRRLCEQSVSLRMADYINFLERFGYLTYDRATQMVSIASDGERVVGGEKMAELVIDVVHHFRPILSRTRAKEDGSRSVSAGGAGGAALGGGAASGGGAMGNASLGGTSRAGATQGGPVMVTDAGNELLDDRYEKLRPLGTGGIGTVYLARQVHLGREVALKEVRELFSVFTEPQRQELVRRFDEELRRSASLFHPNIVPVIDGNTAREYPYMVSEYLPGGSLRGVLDRAVSLPPDLCVKVFLQVLHGLSHAHNRGVVHRSLKPENILFDSAGNVRITDFGMARMVERDDTVIKQVYVGRGSVAYMAPELFTDQSSVGPQSDLYAAGIILYEMLARKLPGRRSPMPTKLFPDLPPIVDDIFDKLTQDEREDRYSNVEEVLEDFFQADAAKSFLEPRGAVLFLQSPLDKLEWKEPPQEVASAVVTNPTATAVPPTAAPQDPSLTTEVERENSSSTDATDAGTEEADGEGRRRRHRPYSFQQRMKARDGGSSQ
jgi:serine/threonine protein kinase